ncbi:hypothetical protein [Adhaeribacter soli]|uniref:Uncharacterized protein n=1 Tax=Adhaeribacter soli TaxID=2607655 RepID=A0A5N1J9V4_9BACT|nr:hypothetical protein [Adhaeribacter soli]KAA9346095.1 hypothetical protein F0P94_03165 [Adhaeribacter soli]
MEKDKIKEACFHLATDLLCLEYNQSFENVDSNLPQLSRMTDGFHRIALENLDLIKDLGGSEELLVRAINYVSNVHAIPPLIENYRWFDNTLRTLLELACPNSGVTDENKKFLHDLINGINESLED